MNDLITKVAKNLIVLEINGVIYSGDTGILGSTDKSFGS